LPTGKDDDPLKSWIASCGEQFEQTTDITLQELLHGKVG
jgi:hypothetical protein